jgi:hypothetical protein
MTGQPSEPQPSEPQSRPYVPGSPDEAEWDKASVVFATEQLTRARASATAWVGTVGTLLGLFGAVAVIGGTDKLEAVPGTGLRWFIVVLVVIAGVLAVVSIVTGVNAAHDAGLRTSDNWSGMVYRAEVVRTSGDILDKLRRTRWTGIGAALAVFAIGLIGLISVAVKTETPSSTKVIVVDQGGAAMCGPIGRTAAGQLTLNGTPVGVVRDVTPVADCPAPAPAPSPSST